MGAFLFHCREVRGMPRTKGEESAPYPIAAISSMRKMST